LALFLLLFVLTHLLIDTGFAVHVGHAIRAVHKEAITMIYSAKDLQGYAIQARDGDLGKVQTFYFDDND
jgi:hypothetical protein